MDGIIKVSAVEYWASIGRLEQVAEAMRADPNVNVQSQGGHTALHAAALNGFLEVVKFLVTNGADCTLRLESGHTAYDLAIIAGHAGIAEYLKHCQPG